MAMPMAAAMMVGIRAASMVAAVPMAAALVFAAMAVAVMVALNFRIIIEAAVHQGLHRLVCQAGNAAIELDASLGQGVLRPGANAAADEDIHLVAPQEAGQSAMAAAGGIHHLAVEDLVQAHIIKLELLGMAKVLEDLAVFIGHCNTHLGSFFLR